MAQPFIGITKPVITGRGIAFGHSSGASVVSRGTPAYNAVYDLLDLAQRYGHERAVQLAGRKRKALAAKDVPDATFTTPAAPRPGFLRRAIAGIFPRLGAAVGGALEGPAGAAAGAVAGDAAASRTLSMRLLPQRSAPISTRVIYAPPPSTPAAQPPVPPQPETRRPVHPDHIPVTPAANALPTDSILFLHHWEIIDGKDGPFLRGSIAGHPHYPDFSQVETAYLRHHDKEAGVFVAADGTIISLGLVRPGLEAKQSVRLAEVKGALREPEKPVAESTVQPPAVESIIADGERVVVKYANWTKKMTFAADEPLAVVFHAAVAELAQEGIQIAPQSTHHPSVSSPSPTLSSSSASPTAMSASPKGSPMKPPSVSGDAGIGAMFTAFGSGAKAAGRQFIVDSLATGKEVTFTKKAAIEVARKDNTLVLRENSDGSVTVVGIAPASTLPPIAPGMVRFYHGGVPGKGARWVSPNLDYALGYAQKSGTAGVVQYVDIPETHPVLDGKKAFPDHDTTQKAPYTAFEMPADIMEQAKVVPGPLPKAPATTDGQLNVEAMEKMLKDCDWTCEMSDDPQQYKRGIAHIEQTKAELLKFPLPQRRELWAKHTAFEGADRFAGSVPMTDAEKAAQGICERPGAESADNEMPFDPPAEPEQEPSSVLFTVAKISAVRSSPEGRAPVICVKVGDEEKPTESPDDETLAAIAALHLANKLDQIAVEPGPEGRMLIRAGYRDAEKFVRLEDLKTQAAPLLSAARAQAEADEDPTDVPRFRGFTPGGKPTGPSEPSMD